MTPTAPFDPPAGTTCWFELSSPDPTAAQSFYSALLGWEFDGTGPLGLGSAAYVAGHRVAGVSEQPAGQQSPAFWSVYFRVDDLSAHLAAVDDAGGQALMAIPEFDGTAGVALIADTAGTAFGVLQYDDGRALQALGAPGAVEWAELFAGAPAVRDFYTAVFDWELPALSAQEEQGYWAIDRAGMRVGGIFDATGVSVPPHWEAHLRVDDVDALVTRVQELGGDVLAAPHDSHHGRVGRFIDAQNAAFTLVSPARG